MANYSSAVLEKNPAPVPSKTPDLAHIQPPPPIEITHSLQKFKAAYPEERKTAFIMMRYGKTQAHSQIAPTIKAALQAHSITGMRVDERQYHSDL